MKKQTLKPKTKMTLTRDQRQEKESEKFIESGCRGILALCPRFGKIRTSILAMQKLGVERLLVLYPLNTIRDSWEKDFQRWGFQPSHVDYFNFSSVKKINPSKYDLVIIDEIHAMSENEMHAMAEYISDNNLKRVLGLSGSISDMTRMEIRDIMGLNIISEYDIEQGIADGVVSDYEIIVETASLDNKRKTEMLSKHSTFKVTEAYKYSWYTKKIEENKKLRKDMGLLPILRMNVIKKSFGKLEKTKQLISKYQYDRLLVFCGTIDIADSLGIPTYHSKNKDDELFADFKNGNVRHLAVIDMATAGVTVTPISRAIFNYFDSNSENITQRISRLIGLEYDNPDKIARVHIVVTDTIEKQWLQKALMMFNPEKITYTI